MDDYQANLDVASADPIDRFVRLWESGFQEIHVLNSFLANEVLSDSQFVEVLRRDLKFRWRYANPVAVEEYVQRLRSETPEPEAIFDLIYTEYLVRDELGQQPAPDEYYRRFPGQAAAFRDQFARHAALSQVDLTACSDDGQVDTHLGPRPELAPPRIGRYRLRSRLSRGRMGTVNRANDSKPVQEVTAGNGRPITLGNYVLIEKIGSGGMGQVFKARHNRMDRLVALKLLPSAMTRDHAAIARFEREVKAAAKLIHPNIVAAYDADCANGVHFLVMELVEGRDLNALVKTGGPFSVDKALNCVIQAARGMESAHRKGIVHRDIKPSNLLLDVEGTVKVLDMGLARVEISSIHASIETKLTRSGAIVGTFDYMSPEQALDSRSADARADIYSLGCTLYYLITGKPIYSGNTALEKILAHREQPIPLLKDVSPLVPNALEAIFQKMVAKKIEDRYQAMSEVLVDFEKYNLGGEMTVVRDAVGSFSSLSNSPFLSVSSSEPTLPVSDNRSARRPAIAESNKKLIWICAGIVGAIILVAMLIQPSMLNNGEATSQALEYSIVSDIHQQQPVIAIATASSDKSEVVAGSESIAMDGGTKPLFCHTPGFEDWVQKVAGLPADRQLEAVSKKLVELNPKFDGQIRPVKEGDAVIGLDFLTEKVADISPVRGCRNLKYLWCSTGGPLNPGLLVNLSPLTGMSLTYLWFNYTRVSDLSPLQGMQLKRIYCDGSSVRTLEGIKGLPLIELNIARTAISDLSPLKDMQLIDLNIDETSVVDLAPLKGMPLIQFSMHNTKITNLSPLKELPIEHLCFDFNAERDREVLRSLKKLQTINGKSVAEFWMEAAAK